MRVLPLARSPIVIVALAVLASCRDGASPPKPSSVEIVNGATQTSAAGQKVPVTPSFVVKDEQGRAMSGVPLSISITAGNGILVNAPTKTTDGQSTTVGEWSLGPALGLNQLTIVVSGLAPVTVSATAKPGAPARIVAITPLSVSGRVAEQLAIPPSARVTDAFDNAIPSTDVRLSLTGGGSAPATAITDAQGVVAIPGWTLGTIA